MTGLAIGGALLASVGCSPSMNADAGAAAATSIASGNASAPAREAGPYRDSRLCFRNLSSDVLEITPGDSTRGVFTSLKPQDRACFDSDDTAEAKANVGLLFADDIGVAVSAENYLIGKPDLVIQQPFSSNVSRQSLSQGDTGQRADFGAHVFQPRRLADADYWIVYEVDVLS